MSFKAALTAGLLLFVAASVAATVARHVTAARHERSGDVAPDQTDALVVYYFRANVRCAACRTLEACSREVVTNRFAEEAAEGRIQWLGIDYQSPGKEHFVSDYQLLTGGVVLVQFRNGCPQRFAALTEAWNMTGNRALLAKHLEDRIRTFQAAPQPEQRP